MFKELENWILGRPSQAELKQAITAESQSAEQVIKNALKELQDTIFSHKNKVEELVPQIQAKKDELDTYVLVKMEHDTERTKKELAQLELSYAEEKKAWKDSENQLLDKYQEAELLILKIKHQLKSIASEEDREKITKRVEMIHALTSTRSFNASSTQKDITALEKKLTDK